jgi:flagellar basal body-associated protein FliL
MRAQDMQEPVDNAMRRLVIMIMIVLVVMAMIGLAGLAWPPQRRKSHGAKYAPERDLATTSPASPVIEWLVGRTGGHAEASDG